MPFADVGDFRLYYSLEGDKDKPVVLLSNSLGADASMWDAQVPALLRSFRVLRYDTRGHGQSGMPDGAYMLDELGSDVLRIMDHAAVETAHLCGVSLGGLTAMWVALHAPFRLRSVVLSNTAAKIGAAATWNERIAAIEAKGLAGIVDSVPLRWFTPAYQANTAAMEEQKAMLLRCSDMGYVRAAAVVRDADLREQVCEISLPTLVISGIQDLATPPSDGRALAESIAGALFMTMAGAHLSNIEHPEAYNRILLTHLQGEAPMPGQPL